MGIPIIPLGDQIVAKATEKPKQTPSGLYIPSSETDKKESNIAEVLAVGEKVKKVSVGDRIIYKKPFEATEVTYREEKYLIVDADNIIAKVK